MTVRAENLDSKVYNGDIGYMKDVAPDDGELTEPLTSGWSQWLRRTRTLVPLCRNHPAKLLAEGLWKAGLPE